MTIQEVSGDKAHARLKSYFCAIGWERGTEKWVDKGQLFARSNSDKWMHAL